MAPLNIAVIGAGGTGMAMAADLTLKGHHVTIFEQPGYHQETTADLLANSTIELTGNAAVGTAHIHRFTQDITEVLEGAELVLVSAVANRHQELAQLMAPYLCDGQTVCFSSGNCASLRLAPLLGEKKVLVGELQGNIYPCRKIGPRKVLIAMPATVKNAAAFPGKDTPAFLASLGRVYPCQAVKNVFEATLNSPNLVIHLAGSLLNAARMESMDDFRLYRDGLTPSVFRLIEAMEVEKKAVMDGMGYTAIPAVNFLRMLGQPQLQLFRDLDGPTDTNHRYITEDAYAGVSLLASLAAPTGTFTPVAQALISIASALNRMDYAAQGLSLRTLGLENLDAARINQYLESGHAG